MTDPIALRNRFAMVKGAWEEQLRGVPFPSLGEGTAEQAADAMWGLVHARADGDPVKQRVTQHHEELARLSARRI